MVTHMRVGRGEGGLHGIGEGEDNGLVIFIQEVVDDGNGEG
jgi:hypothetical protein